MCVFMHMHMDHCFQLEKLEPTSVTVTLSGDGANIAASATMVFLTFSFPGLPENVMSAAGKAM